MLKKTLILFVVITSSWFGIFCGNASAVDIFWEGDYGCSWSDYRNWRVTIYPSPPGDCCVPDSDSDVILNNAESVCLDTSETAIIHSLKNSGESRLFIQTGRNPCLKMVDFLNQGELKINGWEEHFIEITGSFVNDTDAVLNISTNLSFQGSANLLNAGEFCVDSFCNVEMHDGEITNSGKLEIDGKLDNVSITNSGVVQVNENGVIDALNLLNNATIQVYGGSLNSDDELINSDSITGWGVVFAESSFQNQMGGAIIASYGALRLVTTGTFSNNGIIKNLPLSSLDILDLSAATEVVNSGTIEVNTGGGVAVHTNLRNSETIHLFGGALSANTIIESPGATFSGFGNITADIVIENSGAMQLTGPTNVVGDVTIGTNATLEVRDGQTLVTGHTTNNGTIHIIGGTIIFQGGLTNNGDIIRESSTYSNASDFNYSGSVDGSDLAVFASEFGWTAGDE